MPGVADYPWTPLPPPIDQFWGRSYVLSLIGQDVLPFNQRDWPVPTPPFRLDQTWLLNLNNTTLGVVILAPFQLKNYDWPVPPAPLRIEETWAWSYNLNLIGQDALPAGDQRLDLSPIWPPYINHLRIWSWQYNLNLIGKDRLPAGKQVYDLTLHRAAPQPIEQTWTWRYVLMIGKDQLPAGEQISDLAPAQKPYEQAQLHSWQWDYNLNLIGQDRLPTGEQVWERPTLPIPPHALTWAWSSQIEEILRPFFQTDWPLPTPNYRIDQTLAWRQVGMLGQDQLAVGRQIYELAPIYQPYINQLRTWQWSYNLNLVGQDRLAVGKQFYDRPQLGVPPALTWTDPSKIWLLAPILNISITQFYDRPQLPVPPAQTWSWQYNLNLIGQDAMIKSAQVTDLAPRDFTRLLQTWIQSVNIALLTQPEVLEVYIKRSENQVPRGYEPDWRRSWEWQYNKNLIGQDALPFRQNDWPLTSAPAQAAQTWIDQTKIALFQPTYPLTTFSQYDWAVPRDYQRQVQTWTNSVPLALVAKPTAQYDWPTPTPFARDPTLAIIAESYNRNLVGRDKLPVRQSDWPLSSSHALAQIPLQIMVQGKWFNLLPPPPLALPLNAARLFDRPQLLTDVPANLYFIGYSPLTEPFTPPPVVGIIPLRTLMGTGV
jgi:hypothetical protein